MEPPPGIRARSNRGAGGLLAAAGRLVGFCMLATAALAIFAGTMLLPDYARMVHARYELGRQQAANADLEALIQANDRLIAALPDSPVLTKRLAMNQFGVLPEDELVLVSSQTPPPPPGAALTSPHPRPRRPQGRLLDLARRLQKPRTRRGLLLLAAAAMLAALFLFPARDSSDKP